MKKLIPISLFAFVMVFCGCEEEPHQYYLPDAVKPLFFKGDTFYYYSAQTKLTDTVVVCDLHYGFQEEDGEKKLADSYEYAEVSYDFINKKI